MREKVGGTGREGGGGGEEGEGLGWEGYDRIPQFPPESSPLGPKYSLNCLGRPEERRGSSGREEGGRISSMAR